MSAWFRRAGMILARFGRPRSGVGISAQRSMRAMEPARAITALAIALLP